MLRAKGTLLKIDWLDTVCGVKSDTGNDVIYTDVYDARGNIIAHDFNKGNLSALIAELTFELPQSLASDRKFLEKIDLLDFLERVHVKSSKRLIFIPFCRKCCVEVRWRTYLISIPVP